MYKTHDSSKLAKQVAKKLHLNQEDGLKLYTELSQISNGFVKDALDTLTQDTVNGDRNHNVPKKYVACIKGTCVRDAQYATQEDAEMLDDDIWKDAQEIPLFLGIVEAETSVRAKQIIAAREGVNEDVIMLTEI